jgi:hypothetical protein
MSPITQEKVQGRVKKHLDLRYKDRRGEKFSRLILEALVDKLKIYRMHSEVERDYRVSRAAMSRRVRQGDRGRSRGEAQRDRSPRRNHGKRPVRDQTRPPKQRLPSPPLSPRSTSPVDYEYVMAGGLPLGTVPPPRSNTPEPRMEKRRKRSLPIGPAPKYKPKLDFTLGWGTHLISCVKYVAEVKAKEKRSNERKERRRKKYEAMEVGDEDLEFHRRSGEGRKRHSHATGHLESSSNIGNRGKETPNGWSYPPEPKEPPPPPPADPAYHQTPHSLSVEERERAQSKKSRAWVLAPDTDDKDLPYHKNPKSRSMQKKQTKQNRSGSVEAKLGKRGRIDRKYMFGPEVCGLLTWDRKCEEFPFVVE